MTPEEIERARKAVSWSETHEWVPAIILSYIRHLESELAEAQRQRQVLVDLLKYAANCERDECLSRDEVRSVLQSVGEKV